MAKKETKICLPMFPGLHNDPSEINDTYSRIYEGDDIAVKTLLDNEKTNQPTDLSDKNEAGQTASVNKKPKQSSKPKSHKEKSVQISSPLAGMATNEDGTSLWSDFNRFAKESQNAKKKDTQVWIDESMKIILEKMRCAGIRLPIKHLLNGMLKAFIMANKKEIEKLIGQKINI